MEVEHAKKFTLKYKKESNGEIISIESRRTVEDIVLVPTLTATATGLTSASATWTAVAGATGYELQRSTSASFTSPTNMTFTTLSESLTSLTPGTTYHLRVRATLPSPVSFSDWSVPVNVTTMTLSDPNGTLAIAAAMSGTSAQGTASGATCVSGSTTEYQIRNNTNGGSWSGYISGAVQDVTSTTEGHEYEFQARARCVVGASQSDWVSGATTASVIRPVTAPSGLLVSSVMSGTNAHGTASGGSCAAGTTIERQLRYNGSNTAASGVWSGWTNGTSRDVPADQGYRYTFQQQARCVGARANSEYAMGGTGSVIRPLVAPGAPSVSPSTNGQITTYARSNLTCASGAYIRYQYRFLADWGYDSGWNGPTTSATVTWNTNNQGYNYRVQWRGECYNTLTASGYGAANEGSYIRPVDAPGAYTYSHWRDNTHLIWMRVTAPCGPGAGLYGAIDMHTWDFPWLPGYHYGWRRNSLGWMGNGFRWWGSAATAGAQTQVSGGIPGNSRWNVGAQLRCQNYTTGRASGYVWRESGIYTFPR